MDDFRMQGGCPECGLIHPPIASGLKCPMAKDKTSSGELIDASDFLVQMKNIVISKIQSKGIKDYKKVFTSLLIESIKFLDQYKEG
jgi:hypothetical protein